MNIKHLLILSALTIASLSANAFTIVIDAGHGGNDAGAVGSFSKEKNINLRHALLVGDMLKERNPEIKVIYTRDKDVFIELNERARIANRNKADLFISIHTNSSKNKTAHGIETFSLGVSRDKENMEVAMLENSVILLEEDHESKYQGFDPNSTDSYIMFEFMKDEYSQRSIGCANYVQTKLIESSQRTDRGVRQAGFLVLRATAMPAILIELGFISNKEEEKALNNNDNQIANAESIYKGIISYIHSLEKKGGEPIITPKKTVKDTPSVVAPVVKEETPKASETTEANKTTKAEDKKSEAKEAKSENKNAKSEEKNAKTNKSGIIFKLQIMVSSTKRKANDPVFKGVKGVEESKEAVGYKYFIGSSSNYDSVVETKKQYGEKFPGCFIVAYKDGVRINTQEAIKEATGK